MQAALDRPMLAVEAHFGPVAALVCALDEIAIVVSALEPDAYSRRLFPGVSGSIGEHVRHCLDHVAALVSADPSICLSYDQRERGIPIEADPAKALRRIEFLRIKLLVDCWSCRLDEPIRVACTLARNEPMVTTTSTLGRELAFVLTHTIHHQAMIGLLASMDGCGVPDGFGFAPSTPRQ